MRISKSKLREIIMEEITAQEEIDQISGTGDIEILEKVQALAQIMSESLSAISNPPAQMAIMQHINSIQAYISEIMKEYSERDTGPRL